MDPGTAASVWNEVAETNEMIAQAAAVFDGNSVDRAAALDDVVQIRRTLAGLTAASEKLARMLDALASHYDAPDLPEPPAMYVALEQAAAAAEDLCTCAQVAADSLGEGR